MAAKESSKPKDINFSDIVVDITFHPGKDVIAAGTIEGDVSLYSYSNKIENSELMTLSHHKKSCRVLRFSEDGETLYTGSKDQAINVIDLNTGTLKYSIPDAHSCPLYSMLVTGENYIATGDDDGYLKLWDLRLKKAVMEMRENEEFISDIKTDTQRKMLLTTSGDGTLTAFNLRRRKLELQSELFDSEFLSLAIVKRGQKVVCGCGMGELNIFNWGEWGNISDRFPGHPMSVDCMVPLTEDIVLTGSCDGKIRATNILPTKFIGVVGDHPGDLPVENITLSRDKKFLASCSHDQKIKFWNVENVEKELGSTSRQQKGQNRGQKEKFLKSSEKADFFSGLADEPGTSKGGAEDSEDEGDEWETDDDDDDVDDDEDDDDDEVVVNAKDGEDNGIGVEEGNGEGGNRLDDDDSDDDDDDDDDGDGDDVDESEDDEGDSDDEENDDKT